VCAKGAWQAFQSLTSIPRSYDPRHHGCVYSRQINWHQDDLRSHTADDATAYTLNLDYSTGIPRHHHSLYLEDGNIVIQVYTLPKSRVYNINSLTRLKAESAIFKIHRHFLRKYSTVLHDMLSAPQQDDTMDGTDEKPLVLARDTAVGWELLLDAIYDRFVSLTSA